MVRYLIFLFSLLNWVTAHSQFPAKNWEARLDDGYFAMQSGDFEAALAISNEGLHASVLHDSVKANFYTLKGNAMRRSGQPAAAIIQHEKASNIRLRVFGANSELVANCLQNIANCHWDLGDAGQAAFFFKRNLEVRLNLYPTEDSRLVLPLMNLADARFELEQVVEAEKLFQKALAIEAKTAGRHTERAAILLTNIAGCYFKKMHHRRALDTLQAALAIFQKLDKAIPREEGRCLQRIGACLLEMGNNEAARQYFQAALHLFEGDFAGQAVVQYELGRVYRYRDEPNEAINFFSEAVTTAERLPVTPFSKKINAAIWLQFSSSYLEIGDPAAGLYYAEKALKQSNGLPNQQQFRAAAWLKLGSCHFAQQDFGEAHRCFSAALRDATDAGDANKIFAARQHLGKVAHARKNDVEALRNFKLAARVLQTSTNGDTEQMLYEKIQSEAALAGVYKSLATQSAINWNEVLKHTLAGIELIQLLKGKLQDERSELDIQAAFYQLYNLAIEATLTLGGDSAAEKAFQLAEQYRENLFKKLAQQSLYTDRPEGAMIEEQRRVGQALALAEKKRADMAGTSNYMLHPESIASLDSTILQLAHAHAMLQQQIAAIFPAYHDFWQGGDNLSTAHIRSSLRPGQTLLEYQWGEGQLFVFLLSKDTFLVKTLPLPAGLENGILKFFNRCSQNPEWLADNEQELLPKLGFHLYQVLLEPLEPWLGQELIIIPDAWLCYLPFDALLNKPAKGGQMFWEYPYLIYTKSIGYAFSAALFNRLNNWPLSQTPNSFLAFAPTFDGNPPELAPLSHNLREAVTANKIFKGKVLEGNNASKAKLLELAATTRLLLFATHGVLDGRNAAWSYIAFSQNKGALAHELLYAWEIYGLRLNAELVILSACQTANGKMYRGEGLISLARAFQFAGARSVTASLWNVDDKQTPDLMKAFFEELAGGAPKPLALAVAKRRYLATSPRLKTHPFFWAGFVMNGADGPVSPPRGRGVWYWLLGGSALIIFTYIFYRKNSDSTKRHFIP